MRHTMKVKIEEYLRRKQEDTQEQERLANSKDYQSDRTGYLSDRR